MAANAPDGQARVSGSSNAYQGSIWADTVSLTGSNWTLAGAPGFTGPVTRGLVE
jgi:hypothetical protein